MYTVFVHPTHNVQKMYTTCIQNVYLFSVRVTIRFPNLKENQLIIPGTMKLTFNITLVFTDVNGTLVENLGRNIIRKLVVKLEGNEIISIDDYDILYSFYDCWKCKTERLSAVL